MTRGTSDLYLDNHETKQSRHDDNPLSVRTASRRSPSTVNYINVGLKVRIATRDCGIASFASYTIALEETEDHAPFKVGGAYRGRSRDDRNDHE